MSSVASRPVRPLGVVFLVVLSVFVIVSIAGVAWLLLGGAIGGRTSVLQGGTAKATWAFPGAAFRAPAVPPDGAGWRVVYVLANKDQTLVLSVLKGGPNAGSTNGHNGIVTLTGTNGHSYDEQQDPGYALPDATRQFYAVSAFPAVQAGTTAVVVHHNVSGGGTVRVPLNAAQAFASPGSRTLNQTKVAGRVSVTLTTLTRGALLSQVDLQARGFTGPGGEQTQTGPNAFSQRPVQVPSSLQMRTATGVDLAPQVAEGPVDKGMVTTTIGFAHAAARRPGHLDHRYV